MIPKQKTRHAVAVSLRLIRAFRAEIAQERWLISISGFTVLGAVLFRTLEPWPLKFVYNSIFPAKNHVLPLAVLRGLSPQALVAFFTVSMIAMTGLAATFEYLSTISMGTAASRILARVRRKLFQHLENLPVSFHSRNKTGD